MRPNLNGGPIMIRSDADLPYINEVLRVAHRATNIVYRTGPAHRVQLVVPSARHPSPQSAVIRTLRRTRRCSNTYSNLRAAYGRVERLDTEAGSAATNAETGHIRNETSNRIDPAEECYFQSEIRVSHEEDRPRNSGLCAADFDDKNSEDTLCENVEGKGVAPIVPRAHRVLCDDDFEDSEDEGSLCDDADIRGRDLEGNIRWSNSSNELRIPQEHQLTTTQLQIQENVLRDIVQQALKAPRNGKVDSGVFSKEAPEEKDWLIEVIVEVMGVVQSKVDVGTWRREEGRDIQMMLRNNFYTLMRKATRPFRPSGIRVADVELTQCLEAFRQTRFRLLQENAGMSMAEILKERSLDLRPR